MSWRNLKIGKKLYIGFGLVLVLTVAIGYIGYDGLTSVGRTVELADEANRLIKFAKDCRLQEKNFIMRGDKKYQEENNETMTHIYTQIDETKAKFKDHADITLIEETKVLGQKYKEAYDGWIVLYDERLIDEDKMVVGAREFMAECDRMRADQKQKLNDELNDPNSTTEQIVGRLWKADAANRLIKYAQDCRIQEKNFIMRGDRKYQEENNNTMQEIY